MLKYRLECKGKLFRRDDVKYFFYGRSLFSKGDKVSTRAADRSHGYCGELKPHKPLFPGLCYFLPNIYFSRPYHLLVVFTLPRDSCCPRKEGTGEARV